jgi:UDP-glucuronate 4-epimerase
VKPALLDTLLLKDCVNEVIQVIGINNLNDYYDPKLKLARLEQIERVIHLAAQAGLRYSIENPMAYIDSNLVAMATILEGCQHNKAFSVCIV